MITREKAGPVDFGKSKRQIERTQGRDFWNKKVDPSAGSREGNLFLSQHLNWKKEMRASASNKKIYAHPFIKRAAKFRGGR